MKKAIPVILLLFLVQVVFAQKETKPEPNFNNLNQHRFELSFDLLALVGKENFPGHSSMALQPNYPLIRPYRYRKIDNLPVYGLQLNYIPRSLRGKGAFRLQIGGNLMGRDSVDLDLPDRYYKQRHHTYMVRPGYQVNRTFNRVRLHYGVDLHYQRINYKLDGFSHQYSYQEQWYRIFIYQTIKLHQVGVMPYVGVSYCLAERLSVTWEASFALFKSFKQNKYASINIDGILDIPPTYKIHNTDEHGIAFMPISSITLNIHF